jgi:general secretion pathway protein L
VIDDDQVIVSIRRSGQISPSNLGAAARQTGPRTILVRPPASSVLIKHHTIPTAPWRQLDQILLHELARITPFQSENLFWRWDEKARSSNGSRTEVVLTMVPRLAIAPALTALDTAGLRPDFIETGPTESPTLLPVQGEIKRTAGTRLIRGLVWSCALLVIVALALPVIFQSVDLYRTESAIKVLQPTIAQVEGLRRNNAAGDAGRDVLAREMAKTGDVLQTLAAITRILPDDTYLTDFALRERQMTLSGRSASAPRLITGLSADPAIRNTAFAAPVTRIEGATTDVFSIKAEVAK